MYVQYLMCLGLLQLATEHGERLTLRSDLFHHNSEALSEIFQVLRSTPTRNPVLTIIISYTVFMTSVFVDTFGNLD